MGGAGLLRIRLLVLDVDGVLTDGTVWVDDEGRQMKRFAIADGGGLKALRRAGLRAAIISGHDSRTTAHRFAPLGVDDVFVGVADKLACFEDLLRRHHLSPGEAAAMGDDLVDLPVLRAAGWAATVPDAHEEVRAMADYVTRRPGGRGAVREVVELLLRAQGRWETAFSGGLSG